MTRYTAFKSFVLFWLLEIGKVKYNLTELIIYLKQENETH